MEGATRCIGSDHTLIEVSPAAVALEKLLLQVQCYATAVFKVMKNSEQATTALSFSARDVSLGIVPAFLALAACAEMTTLPVMLTRVSVSL